MARRRPGDEGGAAVAEPAPRAAADIATAVAAEQLRQQRERIRDDVEQFRALVTSVAGGHEPDRATLATLGELTTRLRAPADAVTVGVAALESDFKLANQLEQLAARLTDLKKREPELRLQLQEARDNLRALEAEVGDFDRVSQTIPHLARARAENQAKAPLVFHSLDVVVNCLVTATQRSGAMTLDRLQQRRGNGGWQS
jgi:chromosome segregation ATPase